MATREYTIVTPAGPVTINEVATRQYGIQGGVTLNETISTAVSFTPYNPWPQAAPVLAQ